GYQDDATRSMWRYRDYVIRSFNANKPFDQFTLENIAGDLLTALSPEERRDQLIGSGFNRNHRFNEEGGSDPEEFRVAYAVDRTNATATTWLGLTFECAQCHDHKYDPISQRDYYQLYAFFNSVQGALGVSKARRQPPVLELPTPKQTARLESLKTEIAAVNAALKTHESESDARFDRWTLRHDLSADDVDRLVALPAIRHILKLDVKERSNGQNALLQFYFRRHYDPVHRRLTDHRESLRTVKKRIQGAVVTTMIMAKMSTRKPAHILRRGHFTDKGDRVEPNVPAILPPLATGSERDRLALARWLVDGKNPLVARVAVNRLWKQIFGTGIVKTANDFGTRGEPPSHPPLLDWLATELVRCSWDLKTIQRLILTSATYRQAPAGAELGESEQRAVRIDPNNRLLWHSPRYRLVAETIRDNALAIAGLLSRKFGGPSVMPFQPPGYFADKSTDWDWNLSTGNDRYRRGVYTFWRRTTPYPMLTLFDAPSREVCTALRPRTNTPLQALVTMNDPVYVEASRVFAQRVLTAFDAEIDKTLHETLDRALTYAFRTAVSHSPNGEQLAILRRVYQRQLEHYRQHRSEAEKLTAHGDAPQLDGIAPPMLAAWMCVANVLLNMDETITRE
ncbi:MAG: DUF1549 and DUF1553 domain-containing protein, partial [Planctomycetes bacterium]|nr:DUF1549 and DUF1553 domain-containing protein [Planctomycetota bacterium]